MLLSIALISIYALPLPDSELDDDLVPAESALFSVGVGRFGVGVGLGLGLGVGVHFHRPLITYVPRYAPTYTYTPIRKHIHVGIGY